MLTYVEILAYTLGIVVSALGVYEYVYKYVYVERKEFKRFEEKVVENINTSKEFYRKCKEINKNYSVVKVISKTPGLILPSERNKADFREEYFDFIEERLKEGEGNYILKYLFDEGGFNEVLNQYYEKEDSKDILETKNNIQETADYGNIDLRQGKTDPIPGMVIGGDKIACIGFKEETRQITEGVLIKSSELVKILSHQYDQLFDNAEKFEGFTPKKTTERGS